MYSLSTLSSSYPRLKRRMMKKFPIIYCLLGHLGHRSCKNQERFVQKRTFMYKNWHEMLQFALHRFCTSVHPSTGAIRLHPSVYNVKAVFLVKVKVPSTEVPIKDIKVLPPYVTDSYVKKDEASMRQRRFVPANVKEVAWC